jgi:hypothetical protein
LETVRIKVEKEVVDLGQAFSSCKMRQRHLLFVLAKLDRTSQARVVFFDVGSIGYVY